MKYSIRISIDLVRKKTYSFIQFFRNFIIMITEPSPQYSSKSAPRRSNKANRTQLNTENNESKQYKSIIQDILFEKNYDNVTQENAQDILKELKRIHDNLQSKSSYSNAHIINDACTNIQNFITATKFGQIQTKKFEEVENRLDTARNIRENTQSDWKRLIAAAEEKRDQELSDMQNKFNEDLAEFDKLYDEEPDIRFQKLSSELLNLRYRQKAMIQTQHFLEAKQIKNRADKMEMEEREKNKNNWIDYLSKSRIEIVERQKQQIVLKDSAWKLEINKMKKNARAEIKHAKQQEDHFVDRIERIQTASELPEMQNTIAPNSTISIRRAKSQRFEKVEKFERPLDDRQKTFRQRQIMNFIKYTKVTTPKIKKPV